MQVLLSEQFKKDLKSHRKKGNQKCLTKIWELLLEIDHYRDEVLSGKGNPERLKHFEKPVYSRRIDREHRMVYRYSEIAVELISCYGHYTTI